MSIQSFTTLSQTVQQLARDSHLDCETVETLIPEKASDKMLLQAISKLINLNEIVERLQTLDCHQCSLFTADQVKFAFLKWIENHLESIEMQPEWYINKDFKHFDRYLPFDELQDALEREYDIESVYQEIGDAHEAGLFDNSTLEDNFTDTPQQAAADALTW